MIVGRLTFFIIIAFFTHGGYITQANAKDTFSKTALPVEVMFETTMGNFTLQLYPEKAPKTVANFLYYVDTGFYSNSLFHRVIPRFIVQAGGFEKGMKQKRTHAPIINESDNGLLNIRGAISMARTRYPDSATSQFFINLVHNPSLDHQGIKPGYTVFGKVTKGMDVVDKIVKAPTTMLGPYKDVPKQDVVILSAKQTGQAVAQDNERKANASQQKQELFVAGEHYIILDKPVDTRDSSKIEVVEMFSYGCPHCYEFESLIKEWAKQQASDIDYWVFPAVWNKPMNLFARAYYAAHELTVTEQIHLPLFAAIVIEQKRLSNESELTDFFANHGVDKKAFSKAFNSTSVKYQARQAESLVAGYDPSGVPEIIVNGKYRIDRMRAGGLKEMLAVGDFLINKERSLLNKRKAISDL